MTHHTVDYSELSPDLRPATALKDIQEYLGAEKFEDLTALFRAYRSMSMEQFEHWNMLSGISGYPLEAWYEYIWPDQANQ